MSATTTIITDANGVAIQNLHIVEHVTGGRRAYVYSHTYGTPVEQLMVQKGGLVWAFSCDATGGSYGFAPHEIDPRDYVVIGTKVVTA